MGTLRDMVLMQERLQQLNDTVSRLDHQVLDHDKRLVRIETMIAMAQRSDPPGRKRLT